VNAYDKLKERAMAGGGVGIIGAVFVLAPVAFFLLLGYLNGREA